MLIIAEIGLNHNGDMKLAKDLIGVAKEKGADIAKFQLYNTDSICSGDFEWYNDVKKAQLDFDAVLELKEECDKIGIEYMASVFDKKRVEWTEKIGMKRYKIASSSIYNKELINAIEDTGKDIIASLGMYKEKDFPEFNTKGNVDFLYCIAKYPTEPEDLDFGNIDFNKYAGFSDHTIGIEAALIAVARGAKIIEKHFTLDRNMHGPDHKGSMEPKELAQLVKYSKKMEEILSEE